MCLQSSSPARSGDHRSTSHFASLPARAVTSTRTALNTFFRLVSWAGWRQHFYCDAAVIPGCRSRRWFRQGWRQRSTSEAAVGSGCHAWLPILFTPLSLLPLDLPLWRITHSPSERATASSIVALCSQPPWTQAMTHRKVTAPVEAVCTSFLGPRTGLVPRHNLCSPRGIRRSSRWPIRISVHWR